MSNVNSILVLCGASVPDVYVEGFIDDAKNMLMEYGCDADDEAVRALATIMALSENDVTKPCLENLTAYLITRCPAWAENNIIF